MNSAITYLSCSIPGREHELQRAMASVAAQHDAPLHLIAADDGSLGPQVKYNHLAKGVATPWLAFLDDDNYLLAGHLEAISPYFDRGDILYSFDQGGTRPRIDVTNWDNSQIIAFLEENNFLDQSCAMRTELFTQLGGFDTQARYMDWDLWKRAAAAGARFICVPEATWVYGVVAVHTEEPPHLHIHSELDGTFTHEHWHAHNNGSSVHDHGWHNAASRCDGDNSFGLERDGAAPTVIGPVAGLGDEFGIPVQVPFRTGMLRNETTDALVKMGAKVELWCLDGSQYNYWQMFCLLWQRRRDFIIVEHDVIPPPDFLLGFENCTKPWCVHDYLIHNATMQAAYGEVGAFGCVRFRAELMEAHPDAIRSMSDRMWAHLDNMTYRQLTARTEPGSFERYRPHLHEGIATHLHDYAGRALG